MTTPGSPCRSPRTRGSPGRSCWPPSAPQSPRTAPGLDPDRQRDGLHHPAARRPRRPHGFEHELRRLGIKQKNGKPNHPQTQGKVERFQQTLKKWLRAQPAQPATAAGLQALLDIFTVLYNTRRPHRSLPHRATPATAYAARPKATPGDRTTDTHHRVRTDRLDHSGAVTLRHGGRLHHIGTGRAHARTRVLLLIHDLHIRVINAATGELLRDLTLNPDRDYQPTGQPPGPKRRSP